MSTRTHVKNRWDYGQSYVASLSDTRYKLSCVLSPGGALIVLGLLVILGIVTVWVSVAILLRGKLYRRLKPEARPRRWVVISLLILFGVFVVWFPIWMMWPNALLSRILLVLFGLTFFVVGMTIKWLTPLVDAYFQRKGWPLR